MIYDQYTDVVEITQCITIKIVLIHVENLKDPNSDGNIDNDQYGNGNKNDEI